MLYYFVTNLEIYLIHVEMGLWFLLIYFILISMYNIRMLMCYHCHTK